MRRLVTPILLIALGGSIVGGPLPEDGRGPSPAEAFFLSEEGEDPSAPPEPFTWRRALPLDDVARLFREGGFLALCERGSSADVAAALLRGADPNLSNDRGRSALMFALANPDPAVAQVLLEGGADPRAVDREGHPVWAFLPSGGALRPLALLLDFGLNPRSPGASGVEMPFILAAAEDAPATLPLLLDRGVPVDLRDSAGATLLMWAATNPRPGGVEVLLLRGADPRAADGEGRTPLHHALESPSPGEDVIRALLRGGADPNARTVEGTTPLALAARQGAPRGVFEALLEGGALPSLGDEEGLTPCDEARTNPDLRHHREILDLLCP